jgi:hypothetical protein
VDLIKDIPYAFHGTRPYPHLLVRQIHGIIDLIILAEGSTDSTRQCTLPGNWACRTFRFTQLVHQNVLDSRTRPLLGTHTYGQFRTALGD